MEGPCAVFASTCEKILPENIIIDILEVESLPQPTNILENVVAYPWQIRTKYYHACVNLCVMKEKTIGNQEFADSVNAVILCFDSQSDVGLSRIEQWLPFMKEFNSEIKVLVCDYCEEEPLTYQLKDSKGGISRLTAVNWCIKNGFELVELNPQKDDFSDGSDIEDDFPETVGVKRIVQALEAHIWPNMIRTPKGNVEEQDKTNPEEIDDDSFAALFSNLYAMKSKAANLPEADRKDFAEKMALAFWNATRESDSDSENETNQNN